MDLYWYQISKCESVHLSVGKSNERKNMTFKFFVLKKQCTATSTNRNLFYSLRMKPSGYVFFHAHIKGIYD